MIYAPNFHVKLNLLGLTQFSMRAYVLCPAGEVFLIGVFAWAFLFPQGNLASKGVCVSPIYERHLTFSKNVLFYGDFGEILVEVVKI